MLSPIPVCPAATLPPPLLLPAAACFHPATYEYDGRDQSGIDDKSTTQLDDDDDVEVKTRE
jgi:hypothetical protein